MSVRMLAAGALLCSWCIGIQGTVMPRAQAAGTWEITAKASETDVEKGQPFVITVRVRNRSSAAKTENVALHLHKSISVQHVSGEGRKSGDRVLWNNVQFGGGSSRTFTVSATINKGAHGDGMAAMAMAGGTHDSVTVRLNDAADSANIAKNLGVSMDASTTYAAPGNVVQYTVRLNNRGTTAAKNIEVVLQASDHLEFLSASNGGKVGATAIRWNSISLQPNTSLDMRVSARIEQSAQHGDKITVTAMAEGRTAQAHVRAWHPDFTVEQLQLFAFTEKESYAPGEEVQYTMRVRNLALRDEQATLQAYIDDKTRFVSASGDGMQFDRVLIVWENVAFKQGETKSFSLTVRLSDDAPPGSVVRLSIMAGIDRRQIVTRVAAPPPPPTPPEEHTVPQHADPQTTAQEHLRLNLQASAEEAQPGSSVTYAVRVLNANDAPVRNVQVRMSIPGGASVSDAGGGSMEQDALVWNIAHVQPQETWHTTVRMQLSERLTHGNSHTVHVRAGAAASAAVQESHTVRIVAILPQAGGSTAQATVQSITVQRPDPPPAARPRYNQNTRPNRMPAWMLAAAAATGIAAGSVAGWLLLQRENG